MANYLVTGGAGFIGSHLSETLLTRGHRVRVVDDFSTGFKRNLREGVEFIQGDLAEPGVARQAVAGMDYVLHQAAIPSVPRSVDRPAESHRANVDATLQVLIAARDAGVKRVVFAGSSSVYGDQPVLPKNEEMPTNPLSPYALQKLVGEQYGQMFTRLYGLETVTTRYFNVFGPRQDPDGAYAAVIPRWIAAMLRREKVYIYGDGETSRDFCFVDNVVQANLLAATVRDPEAVGQVYNVAVGGQTTLNELHAILCHQLTRHDPSFRPLPPVYRDFRPGDVRYSRADISKIQRLLAYDPAFTVDTGLARAIDWYVARLAPARAAA